LGSKVHLQNILQVSESEQVKEFVAKALVGIDRLIHMVQQLLILSRLDACQEQEQLTQINLGMMLKEIIEGFKNQAVAKGKNIIINDKSASNWLGHETQMRILLRNLLDNAYRYANEFSQISVTLSEDAIIIRNHCAFMSETLLRQSLERFKRGPSIQQGSGLGLSICQLICTQNKYVFSMHNRDDGEEGIEVAISKL
jgi:two-component system sensor histidine kinase QseC